MDYSKIISNQGNGISKGKLSYIVKEHKYHEYNKLLFTRDETIESNYKVKTLFEYDDMKKYLDLSYDKMIERLKKEVRIDG